MNKQYDQKASDDDVKAYAQRQKQSLKSSVPVFFKTARAQTAKPLTFASTLHVRQRAQPL
jgi:hypothetical protein